MTDKARNVEGIPHFLTLNMRYRVENCGRGSAKSLTRIKMLKRKMLRLGDAKTYGSVLVYGFKWVSGNTIITQGTHKRPNTPLSLIHISEPTRPY